MFALGTSMVRTRMAEESLSSQSYPLQKNKVRLARSEQPWLERGKEA